MFNFPINLYCIQLHGGGLTRLDEVRNHIKDVVVTGNADVQNEISSPHDSQIKWLPSTPQQVAFCLKDVRLDIASGTALTTIPPAGRIVGIATVNGSQSREITNPLRLLKIPRHVLRAPNVALAFSASNNYWHFVTQSLPQLLQASQIQDFWSFANLNLQVVVPYKETLPAHALAALQHLPILHKNFRKDAIIASELTLIPFEYPMFGCKWSINALRQWSSNLIDVTKKTQLPTKIVIIRNDNRNTKNYKQIIKILEDKKFTIIDCDNLTLLDQITLFSEAKVIAAPHGAGLANMIWAPQNCTILEFQTTDYWHQSPQILAKNCNHIYFHFDIVNSEMSLQKLKTIKL